MIIWTLSYQNNIGKSGIPFYIYFYIQESTDSFDPKDLTELVVTNNQDNSELSGPSLVNNEVLDNTLIIIVMFTV